ncbi:winged helix-turn-helix domain-containing protein [Streptomyces sp. UH6]|uniref:winged helix-turn-helix domain-containing protein n=1 Tax=Streptomyces sp. UH6 TaxID=2748379 RepID=UPI0015D4CB66|nr:winged helix-turn-helix domain-containing protein [Streptomyces sp. UH6]NYV72999.1 winged helix-turn-helix transcriptional regulator [Streptomyces sp. UH6]
MKWKAGIPRWRQVYDVIEGRILDGTYPPGSQLPSIQQLVREFGFSEVPARRVLTELGKAGLAEVHPGIGTFVTELPEPK